MKKISFFIIIVSSILIFAGYLIGGIEALPIVIAIAFTINFVSYYFSDRIFLATTGAVLIIKEDMPWIYDLSNDVFLKANLRNVKIYLIPDMQPNAFATGRNKENAVIAVSAGLLKLLDKEEVKAVIAHEVTHIKNNDMLIDMFAATLGSLITILAHIIYGVISSYRRDNNEVVSSVLMDIAFFIFAPFLAVIIRSAISRDREYLADAGAVKLTGSKDYMISALRKIYNYVKEIPSNVSSPSTAHMYIANPMAGSNVMKLLSTHPTLEERIKSIENLTI